MRMLVLIVSVAALAGCGRSGSRLPTAAGRFDIDAGLGSKVAFTKVLNPANPFGTAEIYVMGPDGNNQRRLTDNDAGEAYASWSPDGMTLVFDSNRSRAPEEPMNTSDLFLMSADGSDQRYLARGSSATWSPDGKKVAFHRSASGLGLPIRPEPGAPTSDSDIFAINVDGTGLMNLTSSPAIDDDADWSPSGRSIVFTSNREHAIPEVYVMNADGTGESQRLTNNEADERAPAWSPDGRRIAFMSQDPGPGYQIYVMNADGSGRRRVTQHELGGFTPSWSPDGLQIMFHRYVQGIQLFTIDADGTNERQVTFLPNLNLFPNWRQGHATAL